MTIFQLANIQDAEEYQKKQMTSVIISGILVDDEFGVIAPVLSDMLNI